LTFEDSRRSSETALGSYPTDAQTFGAGLRFLNRLSPTRQWTVSVGGRAARVDTIRSIDRVPLEYVTPSAFGGVQFDFGRTWALTADAHRDIQTLQGLTSQSFITDAVNLAIGGNVGRTLVIALGGDHLQGRAHEGDRGSFQSTGFTGQLQYALSRCCAVVGSYAYYAHRLYDISTLTANYPSRFDRNTLRVGFTVEIPLAGGYPQQVAVRARRRN
jgi:hypothetical protein